MGTKAETRAQALAARFEQAGYTTRVTVTQSEATLFSDGRVMLPSKVMVNVHADGPQSWDDDYSFSFVTWAKAEGHRESTLFAGGSLYRGCRTRRQSFSKKLSLRELGNRLGGHLAQARYNAQREALKENA